MSNIKIRIRYVQNGVVIKLDNNGRTRVCGFRNAGPKIKKISIYRPATSYPI